MDVAKNIHQQVAVSLYPARSYHTNYFIMKRCYFLLIVFSVLVSVLAFRKAGMADAATGAWHLQAEGTIQVLLFMDGYFTHTTYEKATKRFTQTRGGTYRLQKDKLTVHYEFDTQNKEQVGQAVDYTVTFNKGQLVTTVQGGDQAWNRLDNGQAPLAGLWTITSRKQNGELQPIHQTGTRKTVKILTGDRFQWAAIDPGTKQFMGTGGGTYTFKEGKYTEQIEFFSRDSNRVGSALTFDGRLENGDWHHSGLSSKGEPIYEVWSRRAKK